MEKRGRGDGRERERGGEKEKRERRGEKRGRGDGRERERGGERRRRERGGERWRREVEERETEREREVKLIRSMLSKLASKYKAHSSIYIITSTYKNSLSTFHCNFLSTK